MIAAPRGAHMSTSIAFVIPAMVAVLTTASLSMFTVTVLAPAAAPALGFPPTIIGVYVSISYLLAMFSGAVTGTFVARFGPVRVCQATMAFAPLGLLALAAAAVWPPLALVSAALIGCAYGPYNPASAHVLQGVASARWQPFVFSLKQIGVPLGGMLAGAVVPGLALHLGWRGAALASGSVGVLVLLVLQPLRARFDAGRDPGRRVGRLSIAGPLRIALGHATLRRYTIAAFAYAGCQVGVGSYMVVYFTQALHLSLVRAGAAFAFVQAGGVAGRLLWGALAGRLARPRLVLAFIGLMTAACLGGSLAMSSTWPFTAIAALATLLGMSSFGWNGVMLSEIATHAPPGMSAEATGGMQFVMFGGVTLFPSLFGAVVGLTGGYGVAFGGLGALGVFGAVMMGRWPGARTGGRRPEDGLRHARTGD